MKTSLSLGLALMTTTALAAGTCRTGYDDEQRWLLEAAYAMGAPHGFGAELAGLIERESFDCRPGERVCRENPEDGDYGSYGVTQVQVSTALWMLGWENDEHNRAELRRVLTTCDTCALEFGLEYLLMWQERGTRGALAKYNGRGAAAQEYAQDVLERAKRLKRCGMVGRLSYGGGIND